MKKQKTIICLLVAFLLITVSSCAPSDYSADEYGFFSGILHGILFFFSLIGKLLGFDIGLYAEHNSGFLYWLGFIIGIGGLGGGGARARR